MTTAQHHFETLQLHAGQEQPDPATDARAVRGKGRGANTRGKQRL